MNIDKVAEAFASEGKSPYINIFFKSDLKFPYRIETYSISKIFLFACC